MLTKKKYGQGQAAGALGNLAMNKRNAEMICADGGIQALIEVLAGGSQDIQMQAAFALGNVMGRR